MTIPDTTLPSAVLEADEEMTPGPWELPPSNSLNMNGKHGWFLRTQGKPGYILGMEALTEDAEGLVLFRTAAPILARRVMELEAELAPVRETLLHLGGTVRDLVDDMAIVEEITPRLASEEPDISYEDGLAQLGIKPE